jgi:hypothetical protein
VAVITSTACCSRSLAGGVMVKEGCRVVSPCTAVVFVASTIEIVSGTVVVAERSVPSGVVTDSS